jgi:signal transduction histidine kinase
MLREHAEDLGVFMTQDERGKMVPSYLEKLAKKMADEQLQMLTELTSLTRDIGHIKEIVTMQQSYARVTVDVREEVSLAELMDDALRIAGMPAVAADITIVRDYEAGARAVIDRHKALQILVNLVSNAKHAIRATPSRKGCLTARLRVMEGTKIRMEVSDDGVGIPEENLVKIFRHGFTTKPDGHGFGLHAGALAATQLGGTLTASSDGIGRGATFVLVVPVGSLPPPNRRSSRPGAGSAKPAHGLAEGSA